jgi:hypothetical protein
MRRALLGTLACSLLLAAPAAAVVLHDEGSNGDLSNNRLAPTALLPSVGTNSIIATSKFGDREYFSLTLPAGTRLTAINLVAFSTADVAFIGVQSGATFTEDPSAPNVANILGYTHFGPDGGAVDDILDDMGAGPGSIGFVPPLPSGTYTFWAQQLNGPTNYQLDFVVEPEAVPSMGPGGVLALTGAILGIGLRAARRHPSHAA